MIKHIVISVSLDEAFKKVAGIKGELVSRIIGKSCFDIEQLTQRNKVSKSTIIVFNVVVKFLRDDAVRATSQRQASLCQVNDSDSTISA